MASIPYQTAAGSLTYSNFNTLLDKVQSGLDTITTLSLNTGSLNVSGISYSVGSPYGFGITIPLLARTNISGGMWVSCSGGLALAGPASVKAPIGVAKPGTNVASGGTVQVIINGIVPMIAEGTILQGGGAMPGAGAGLNCVQPHAAGSALFYATLDSAASGTTSTVFVRIY